MLTFESFTPSLTVNRYEEDDAVYWGRYIGRGDSKRLVLHRVDGPAVERNNGDREWWQRDRLHRVGGPAVELANGVREWWQNHEQHREDGPAIINSTGNKVWMQHDLRHRLDGPAIEWSTGDGEWFVYGKDITEEAREWLKENQFTVPLRDEALSMFILKFGSHNDENP
jgi:hypothetical protein